MRNEEPDSRVTEKDLATSDRAKNTPFEQLLGPGTEVNEAEIDRLVEVARNDYYSKRRKR